MRPIFIPRKIKAIIKNNSPVTESTQSIKAAYEFLRKQGKPYASIVIPAYNEEKNILKTLHSLTENFIGRAIEIIVVNNNSTDATEELVKACGIPCITEKKKGITAARNAGLNYASGTYILNADADAIYPSNWINHMIEPLENNARVAITYGRFSFLPVGKTGRLSYFFYEYLADLLKYINKYWKEEAVNVYGFNSAYRRLQGLQVEGYNHPPGTNEDGYLALKLRNNNFGKLYFVKKIDALVWTSDRRIQMEGGFLKGLKLRITKFFFPRQFTQLRTDL